MKRKHHRKKLNQRKALSVAMAVLNGLNTNASLLMPLTAVAQEVRLSGPRLVARTEESMLSLLTRGAQIIEPLFFATAYADPPISSGMTQDVNSGYTATSTTMYGGRQNVWAGGTAVSTIISGGMQAVWNGGTATSTIIYPGGEQDVIGTAAATGTTISGGLQAIWGGTATSTTIYGGLQDVRDGTAMNITIYGGSQSVWGGAEAVSTTIVGGDQHVSSGGTATSTTIVGGTQYVDGTVVSTTISGGAQAIGHGAMATNTTIYGGTQYVDGAATGTTILGGMQAVWTGGTATNTTVYGGEQDVIGAATSTTVYSGGLQAVWGGTATGTTLSGGTQNVEHYSTAVNTTIYSGGRQNVSSGGTAMNTDIHSGGLQVVSSGGTAVSTLVSNGGTELVSAGAKDTSATIQAGGTEFVYGTASSTSVSGMQTIENGGLVKAATVASGGTQAVASGGVTSNTMVSGGTQVVNSGGTAAYTTVSAGTQLVSSGSVVSDTSATSGGTIVLLAGAQLSGMTGLDKASLTLSGTTGTYTVDHLTVDGGTVTLANSKTVGNNLSISTLGGSATFLVNTNLAAGTADNIAIGTVSGTSVDSLKVNYDPGFVSGATVNGSATVVTVASGGSNVTLKGVPTEYGAYTFTPTLSESTNSITGVTSWAVTALTTTGVSETGYTAEDVAANNLMLWRAENNNLNKRMGDLRNDSGQAGEWARVYRGSQEIATISGRTSNQTYTAIQGGYDTKHTTKGSGTWYAGYTIGYLDAEASLQQGHGHASSLTVGAYGSWLGEKGHYLDMIAKQGRLRNSYYDYLNDPASTKINGRYNNWGTSLSVEYGYRKQLANNWYLEPQAEINFGRISAANYTTSDNTAVYNQSLTTAVGRLGAAIGRTIGKDSFYAKASLAREFSANARVSMSTSGLAAITTEQNFRETWLEFAAGWNGSINTQTNSYFEVTRTTGRKINTPWLVNAGVRWNF